MSPETRCLIFPAASADVSFDTECKVSTLTSTGILCLRELQVGIHKCHPWSSTEQRPGQELSSDLIISMPPTCPVAVKRGELMGFCPSPSAQHHSASSAWKCFSGRANTRSLSTGKAFPKTKQTALPHPSPEPQPPRAELLLSPSPAQAVHLALWQGNSCRDLHTELPERRCAHKPQLPLHTRAPATTEGDKRTKAVTVTPPGIDTKPLHVLWGRKLLGIHQAIQSSLLRLRSLRPTGIF